MEAVAIEVDAISAIGGTSTVPFAEVVVTLTKLKHIRLVVATVPTIEGLDTS